MFDKLEKTTAELSGEEHLIPEDRKALLEELSIYIKGKLDSNQQVNLVFICTHNSRRSHMAQVWIMAAAQYYKVPHIFAYSGGTQVTSFNRNAVNALRKAGFKIELAQEGANPRYKVKYGRKCQPLICFSKKYDHKKNPQEGFVAIMTCSTADETCPVISGAYYRTTITYEDPKRFDNSSRADEVYLERSRQIGRKMLYAIKMVSEYLKST